MRRFAFVSVVIAVAAISFAQTRFRRVHPAGRYSNVPEGARARGYTVDLWRVDSDLAGILVVSDGRPGDPPAEVLDAVGYNIRTGVLSFRAKMTTGCDVLPGLKLKPSRESFEFTGTLTQETLKGKFNRKDLDHAERSPSVVPVELARRPDASLIQAGSFNEWKTKAEELATSRQPDCRGAVGEPKKKK
jgi:hypothetical protein